MFCVIPEDGGPIVQFFLMCITMFFELEHVNYVIEYIVTCKEKVIELILTCFTFLVSCIPEVIRVAIYEHLNGHIMFVLPVVTVFLTLVFVWQWNRKRDFKKGLEYLLGAFFLVTFVTFVFSKVCFLLDSAEGFTHVLHGTTLVYKHNLDDPAIDIYVGFISNCLVHLCIALCAGCCAYPLGRWFLALVGERGRPDNNNSVVPHQIQNFVDLFWDIKIVYRFMILACMFTLINQVSVACLGFVLVLWLLDGHDKISGNADLEKSLKHYCFFICCAYLMSAFVLAFASFMGEVYFAASVGLSYVVTFLLPFEEAKKLHNLCIWCVHKCSCGLLFKKYVKDHRDRDYPDIPIDLHELRIQACLPFAVLLCVTVITVFLVMCFGSVEKLGFSGLLEVVGRDYAGTKFQLLASDFCMWPLNVARDFYTFVVAGIESL